MDEYMVVLRLIHIFAGIVWVGFAWFMTFVITPTVRASRQDGQAITRNLFKHSRLLNVMPVTSLLTTVSGLLLYYRISDHFNSDWMSSTAGVVLSIGSVAGIAEFLFGGTVIRPTGNSLAKLGAEIERQGGPPSESQLSQLHALQERMGKSELPSTVLTIVAVIGMAAARYM
ncbi:hypothetical protein [Aggregatilinea lenta]|uniref:hypothetical protein n=1 Tax=Aggregatilinea lenta TaxID=913108 RepID=UPI000E5B0936|nr:hypothetical protein [Aggregatilinea lenta]